MRSTVEMTVDTVFGNAVVLRVEAELDNAHSMTGAELARKQLDHLSVMVAEVRRENERAIGLSTNERLDPPHEPPPVH